ncbi:hypothetical protein ACF0H5_021274 [Mactra antiquata]
MVLVLFLFIGLNVNNPDDEPFEINHQLTARHLTCERTGGIKILRKKTWEMESRTLLEWKNLRNGKCWKWKNLGNGKTWEMDKFGKWRNMGNGKT